MAADSILCNKPCALQNADKSYSEGTLYVYSSRIRFVARGGAAQKLEIAVEDIKGDAASQQPTTPCSHTSVSVQSHHRGTCLPTADLQLAIAGHM